MHRKLCSIGNSQGVSIPREMIEKLNLSAGAELDITMDKSGQRIVLEPVKKKKYPKGIDREFVSQVNEFIEKYRPALKALAKG